MKDSGPLLKQICSGRLKEERAVQERSGEQLLKEEWNSIQSSWGHHTDCWLQNERNEGDFVVAF